MKQFFVLIFIALMFVCQGQTDTYQIVDFIETKDIKGLLYFKADTTLVTGRVIRYNKKRKAKKYIFVKNGVPDNVGWVYYNDNYESPKESVLGSLVAGAAVATAGVMAISGNDIDVPLPINNANKINHLIIQNDVTNILDYNKEMASTGYDEMSQRNEILEKLQLNKNSGIIEKPNNGLYQKKDEDGQVIMEGNYMDGEMNGDWKTYFSNGILESKGNYIKGIKEGLWQEYYENSQLRSTGNYIDEKKDGFWEEYFENGNLASKVNFKEGKKVGFLKNYYLNGQLKGKINYKEGKEHGVMELYHKNGKLMLEGYFKDAIQIGVWKYYDEDGKLINLETFDK